jgi:hypothetical protein
VAYNVITFGLLLWWCGGGGVVVVFLPIIIPHQPSCFVLFCFVLYCCLGWVESRQAKGIFLAAAYFCQTSAL